ncbi:hypothetical protein CO172_01145 [Candidatus Uhrbacteria bacterium CG_4_9_14_3_um_filter_36_7]|uniref:DUF11 domain-containing protein n=1 Tax=Candidatus Uhrbacteria bacterium CG_4_9_14_3_um_filter_36_7 TaxID=1975033 RepID=A0A2M7XI07_9BACT|nr:MAG: hypothetical protein CO172_01145 [Candidatus Uhrbacteria bacterium CG_4_9_14_3_um_filter_36_7]
MGFSLPLKRKRRRPIKDIERELRVIYHGRDGRIPDLTKLEYQRKSLLTAILIRMSILLLLVFVIGIGFLFYWHPYSNTNPSLQIEVEAPQAIRTGEPNLYRVRYANTSKQSLAAVQLTAHFPQGFVFTESLPKPTEPFTWTIGSLSPSSNGVIEIWGIPYLSIPSTASMQILSTYRPANMNSDFQDITTVPLYLTESVVKLALSGPEKTIPGDKISYTITVQNISEHQVKNLRLYLKTPSDFFIEELSPAPTQNNTSFWDIEWLNSNQTMSYVLTGTFASEATGSIPLIAEVGFVDAKENFLSQAQTEWNTELLGGNLLLHLIANGSNTNQTVALSDRLRISLDYKNTGSEPLENVVLWLTFQTENGKLPLNFKEADLEGGLFEDNRIEWDEKNISNLSILNPGESGILDIMIPITPTIIENMSDLFTIQFAASLKPIKDSQIKHTIEGTPLQIQINSDTSFTSMIRYFNDDGVAVGSGPLPPVVGKKTTYRVFWNIHNQLHDLENGSITTSLPKTIVWEDRSISDQGIIRFDETTRMVTWFIPEISKTSDSIQAWFDISITPTESDIGKFIKLTNPTAFEIKDSVTQDTIHVSLPLLTSELPDDPFASSNGVVMANETL